MTRTTEPRRHFSMIRGFHLADFVTLGNAACGTAAIFLAMVYVSSGVLADFLLAAAMAPLAFAFDWLDGRVARWRQRLPRWAVSSIHWPTLFRSASPRPPSPLPAVFEVAGTWSS